MKKILFGLVITSSILSSQALANVWLEREKLEQIETNLAALHTLIAEAQDQSKKTGYKHKFDYKQLSDDVNKIRSGITHYLEAPLEPAEIEPISDEYGEYR